MAEPRPIWYEGPPVSPERKAELRALGYQVVDLWQAPAGWKPLTAAVKVEPEVTLDVPAFLKKPGKVK